MKKFDKILALSVILLSLFGLIMIYSASSIWAEYKFSDSFHYLKYQLLFFIVGLVLMFIVSKIDYRLYYKKANTILICCFILLILVLIPGIGSVRNGSRSWFGIASFGIQPSEFMKIFLMLILATMIHNFRNDYDNPTMKEEFQFILKTFIVVLIPSILTFLQPDTGAVIIYFVIYLVMMFASGIRFSWFKE